MDIWTVDKLALFIAFVIPGFISIKTYELLQPSSPKETGKLLIDAVAYSSINYAFLLWPIYVIEANKIQQFCPTCYALFYTFALFIAPVSWACLAISLRTTKFVQEKMPHPTARAWDYVFSQRKPFWVIVTLKDGKQFAGRYDDQSFASSSPALDEIYLQEAWILNKKGGLERARTATAGILIVAHDIMTVEFFDITYGGDNVGKEAVN